MGNRVNFYRVQLVRERSAIYEDITVKSPDDAATRAIPILRDMLGDADRETFVVLHLNTKHVIVGAEVISVGSLDASIVSPREVYKGAILSNAAAIICAHNHPSGNPKPSNEDYAVTKRLSEASRILGIQLLDHIVVGHGQQYTSLRNNGYSFE